jgi:murein DD-endopeptidase MepM/ murein hydrolase activator NlpD
MRFYLGVALMAFVFSSCGRQYYMTAGEPADADSSFVYTLPYPEGTKHLLVQGYNSWFSHKGRLGLDFKMKKGSPVLAARGGVVVRVQEGFNTGGVNKKYYGKANSVIIKHDDGSQALYGHLKQNGALVQVGDTVRQGQLIAYSGSTGYSAFPHLHFSVWNAGANGRRMLLPTRFHTRNGVKYLKPGKWYKAF